MRSTSLSAVTLLGLTLGCPSLVWAQASQPSGSDAPAYRVLKVEGARLIIDYARDRTAGGPAPRQLVVLRAEEVTDPDSGEAIRGWVPLGRVRLVSVGDRLSVAEAAPGLAAQVEPGDRLAPVVASGQGRAPASAARPAMRTPSRSGSKVDPVSERRSASAPTPALQRPSRSNFPTVSRSTRGELAPNQALSAMGRYVSYGANDAYAQVEAAYAYTFAGIIRSLKFGAGGYLGQTPVPQYNDQYELTGVEPEDVRFYYGLVALELDLNRWLGFITEASLGVNNEGVGGGWSGGVRIGPAEGVNLVGGGSLRSYIGHQAYLGLRIPAASWLGLYPHVLLEEAPVTEELGFRINLQGELRLGRHLGLTAEIGGAARDVKHGGVTGGLGLTSYF